MNKSLQEYQPGTIIFREGDASICAYIIREGQVELTSSGQSGPVELSTVGPGELFGEHGLVDGGLRNTTAMALTACALQVVSKDDFLSSIEQKPGAANSVLKRMAGWLKGATGPEPASQAPTQPQALPAPNAQATNPDKQDKAPPAPPQGPGFFKKLIGATGDPLGKVDIRVALFEGEGGDAQSRKIVQLLDKKPGISAKILPRALSIDPAGNVDSELAAAVTNGRHWLQGLKADLLIWGEIPPPGLTLHLRFIPRQMAETDRPGVFLYSTDLTLPVEFGDGFADLLTAVALSATVVDDEDIKETLDHARAIALQGALKAAEHLPAEVTAKEKAGIQLCFANALATQAYTTQSPELYHRSALAYQDALAEMVGEANPVGWAMAQKNLATVLQFIAERTGDLDTMNMTAEGFRAALSVFNRKDHPLQWAECQGRLGDILYRLDAKEGGNDYLKDALVSFQSAIKVFTRQSSPDRWAHYLKSFAQAAQVLGGQMRNEDVLERAIKACQDIIAVRTFEDHPNDWAAAQNNMGSALFLLAKLTRSVEHFAEAANAFDAAVKAYDSLGNDHLSAVAKKNREKVLDILERRG